jgi:hypothetical protein
MKSYPLSIRSQVLAFRLLARIGFHVHPRDRDMIEHFRQHCQEFELLLEMMRDDNNLGYVGPTKIRVIGENEWRSKSDPPLTPKRWKTYRRLFETLSIEGASHVGQSFTMRISTAGASSKGVVYQPAHRVLVRSLENFPTPPEMHAHIMLDEPWHVYYGWDC